MNVSKKDRVALVLTAVYLLFAGIVLAKDVEAGLVWLVLPIAYWGYRFIKNDISFLKINDD